MALGVSYLNSIIFWAGASDEGIVKISKNKNPALEIQGGVFYKDEKFVPPENGLEVISKFEGEAVILRLATAAAGKTQVESVFHL